MVVSVLVLQLIGVHCPVLDTLLKSHIGIALLQSEVHFLVAEGKSGQYIMVTADDDADGAVRAVVGDTHGIVLVLVG